MEGRDEAEESRDGTLANTIVPLVLETREEGAHDRLDVGEEGSLDGGEDLGDRIGGALLLDRDGGARAEGGVVVLLDLLVHVLELGVLVVRLGAGSEVSVCSGDCRMEASVAVLVRVRLRLTSNLSLEVSLVLDESGEEDGHDGREVDGELFRVYAGDDGEEDVAALLELRRVGDGRRLEGSEHEVLKVRAEELLPDRLGEGSDGVLGDTSEVELISLLDEGEEGEDVCHRRLEVGGELGLGRVGGRSDGSDDGGLEVERGGGEEGEERLHEAGDIGLDVAAEDLEEAVEGDAGGSLSLGVSDELKDELEDRIEVSSGHKGGRTGRTGRRVT